MIYNRHKSVVKGKRMCWFCKTYTVIHGKCVNPKHENNKSNKTKEAEK